MSGEILKHYHESLKSDCNNLKKQKNELKELETKLVELEQAQERDENKISLAKFSIQNKKNEIEGTESQLEGDGKGMAAAMAGINGYELTDEEREFWRKFNEQVMSNFDMDAKCRTCDTLLDFSG